MELPFCVSVLTILAVFWIEIDGNNVTMTPSPEATVTEGDTLHLQCDYTGSSSLITVNWYLNGNSFGLEIIASSCVYLSTPVAYEISRYNKTCSNNSFSLFITNVTKDKDHNDVWGCDTTPNGISPPTKVSTTIKVNDKTTTSSPPSSTTPSPLPEIIPPSVVGVAIIVILLIFFCCGCLDCCQLCRIFDHYEVNKFCYMTCYFIKRGCCSFFYCKSGSKRGKCFCGDHKGQRCGGCLSCRNKCTCGWPGNCKTTDSSCGGYCFCVCCVTARKEEEDPLVLCIDNEDALCRPEDDKVTITCSVNGYGPGDTTVAWTGPQGNKLTNSTKHNITPYNKDTGKSSLTISTLCSSDNGQYTCQVTDGDGFFVKNSILITVHDTDRNTNRKGKAVPV